MKYYYYLHTNGDLIGKPPIVVDSDSSYFDSPFVKKFWCLDLTDRKDAWLMILEALYLGASITRVKELADKWNMTIDDTINFLAACPPNSMLKAGLNIFIEKILLMDEKTFWDKMKELSEVKARELTDIVLNKNQDKKSEEKQ